MNSHLVHRSLARIESSVSRPVNFNFFFFTDTSTTEIYTLSLHDALPISGARAAGAAPAREGRVDLRRRCQCYRRSTRVSVGAVRTAVDPRRSACYCPVAGARFRDRQREGRQGEGRGDGGRGGERDGAGTSTRAAAATPAAKGRAGGRRGGERHRGAAGETGRAGRPAGDARW